jgi:putative serine/threonine protein kinase
MLVKLERLSFEEHGLVLCYPKPSRGEFEARLSELRQLGVEALEFSGVKLIGKLHVLGKGNSALIVKAWAGGKKFALKVRRLDSGKPDMAHEAELTRAANRVNVGPRLQASTSNMLLMELVEGLSLPVWLGLSGGKPPRKEEVSKFLSKVLWQCRRLDEAGIDHGELSRASKHVIVRMDGEPCILDFEKASLKRRPSNVTSLTQFFLLKGVIAERVTGILGAISREGLIGRLRDYKVNPSNKSFQNILNLIGC